MLPRAYILRVFILLYVFLTTFVSGLPDRAGRIPQPAMSSSAVDTSCQPTPCTAYLPLITHVVIPPSHAIAINDSFAYLGTDTGLAIVDIHNPLLPLYRTSVELPAPVTDIQVVGHLAYVTTSSTTVGTLEIIAIDDPLHPLRRSSYTLLLEPLHVAVANEIAYIADWTNGLQIIDVHNPSQPRLRGKVPGEVRDVQVIDQVAYLAAGDLIILDISQPDLPMQLAIYDTPGIAHRVQVINNVAYVAEYFGVSQIIDVQNPAQPTLLSNYSSVAYPGMQESTGTEIYIAGAWSRYGDCSGLLIFDAHNLANVTQLTTVQDPEVRCPSDMQLIGNLAYIADRVSGLEIFDVSNPAAPILRYPVSK